MKIYLLDPTSSYSMSNGGNSQHSAGPGGGGGGVGSPLALALPLSISPRRLLLQNERAESQPPQAMRRVTSSPGLIPGPDPAWFDFIRSANSEFYIIIRF